ncbi:methylaspartate mutase accessory protein GlmL [Chloroflexota bacterium]
MDNIRLLIDFGSTFTKVVAVDLDKEEILSAIRIPSTVDTDITLALDEALKLIANSTGIGDLEKKEALACSSAAGGLRMVCAGFVPDLTSKAANHAALGAGAKVIGCYSYKLTQKEVDEIESASPDIVLISGGTDGGDEQVIIHNADMFSRTDSGISNIIIAGNKTTYDDIRSIFNGSGKNVIYTKNVMPEIGVLDVVPCNKEIRELFMKNIIEAKGIARAKAIIKDVIMPTPSAVMEAAKLIANGFGDDTGLGELIVIDPGGATTDVHSIAYGHPSRGDTIVVGLPEPYEKRTVEGDLGIRHNIDTLLELIEGNKTPPNFNAIVQRFHEGEIPVTEEEIACQFLLSSLMVEVAMDRHAGKIEVINTPTGEKLIQHGKDLTGIRTIIGTGGPIVFSKNPREILEGVRFRENNAFTLKPKDPGFFIDEHYILYAVGLLSQVEPTKALNIARKYLKQI